jgi:hypothetical protein
MRTTSLSFLLTLLALNGMAQYGTFNSAAVKTAKATTTIVVLDGGGTPYDQAIMTAVKGDWKFTGSFEFVTAADMAMQPVSPEKTYLLKIAKVDPVKFEGVFLTLVQGWKPKKGEMLTAKENAFTSIPETQELASMLIDDKGMAEKNTAMMIVLYVRHLQDYLKQVESGKVTDKATADRLYASRARLIRDTEFWIAREHLDKSIVDAAAAKVSYTAPMQLMALPQLMSAVEKQDRAYTISDVVITVGDHKNKHCFKRVFNAGTGELMYISDVQAIFGKKEGFIEDDLKAIERAR